MHFFINQRKEFLLKICCIAAYRLKMLVLNYLQINLFRKRCYCCINRKKLKNASQLIFVGPSTSSELDQAVVGWLFLKTMKSLGRFRQVIDDYLFWKNGKFCKD